MLSHTFECHLVHTKKTDLDYTLQAEWFEMPRTKKRLNVVQSKVVKGTTCFAEHKKNKVCCERRSCDHWLEHKDSFNCVIIAAKDGPRTLQDIGRIYSLTRMRICQIEKGIIKKIDEAC